MAPVRGCAVWRFRLRTGPVGAPGGLGEVAPGRGPPEGDSPQRLPAGVRGQRGGQQPPGHQHLLPGDHGTPVSAGCPHRRAWRLDTGHLPPGLPRTPQKEFAVTMRPTEVSKRCRLRGSYTLRVGESALELWGGPESGTQLYEWPYRFLRRFGRDKVTFSFEAGRRCVSGEGNFEFETRQGNEIFLALEEAISAQKNATSPGPQTQPVPVPAVLPRPESPYARPHDSLPPPSPTIPVPAPRQQRGPEGEYAVPFDAVARSLGNSLRSILAVSPQPPADPLYDSIEDHPDPRPDHIYDEPEGMAALALYDSPQEPLGEAWRRQATANRDSSGLMHGYIVGQDFAASGWPQGTEYDNVVLKKGPK
ncbi:docking protein 2 isoform X2 [Oryx dammah]|uniref:docking protein 2 isoform X2 n=1 Tax=Oryx dammah TaxID=59534 RepID=UPI001A9B9902|nr:docking protein 2 isoform X2 [Oryx dammah]XP_040098292.1 docking protein 2 isoform X2 [Oryx dammah]